VKTSEEAKQIVAALLKVQTDMKPAVKDAENPHFRSKYADLSAVWDAVRDGLKAAKVLVSQDVTSDEHGVEVTTRFTHESAEWMEFGPLHVPIAKRDAQAVGSAISYGRRYSLSAALGIVAEDDDGNAASDRSPASQPTNGHVRANGNGKPSGPQRITRDQRNALRDAAKQHQWPPDKYYQLLGKYGFRADDDITPDVYPTIFQCVHQGTMTPLVDDDSVPF
jgi:hypothetical protein